MIKTFETARGETKVRNIVIDGEFNSIEEGLEITFGNNTIEIEGYKDIDELTTDEVESLIDNNY